jgi:hypothetical protein
MDRAAGRVSHLLDTASAKVREGTSSDGGQQRPIFRSSGGAGAEGSYGPAGQAEASGGRPHQHRSSGGAGAGGSYGPPPSAGGARARSLGCAASTHSFTSSHAAALTRTPPLPCPQQAPAPPPTTTTSSTMWRPPRRPSTPAAPPSWPTRTPWAGSPAAPPRTTSPPRVGGRAASRAPARCLLSSAGREAGTVFFRMVWRTAAGKGQCLPLVQQHSAGSAVVCSLPSPVRLTRCCLLACQCSSSPPAHPRPPARPPCPLPAGAGSGITKGSAGGGCGCNHPNCDCKAGNPGSCGCGGHHDAAPSAARAPRSAAAAACACGDANCACGAGNSSACGCGAAASGPGGGGGASSDEAPWLSGAAAASGGSETSLGEMMSGPGVDEGIRRAFDGSGHLLSSRL